MQKGAQRGTRDNARGDVRAQRAAPAAAVTSTGDRTRRAVFSDGSVDRFNTTISPTGWQLDNFRRNPILLWMHDDSGLPLGRVTEIASDGVQLAGAVEFVPDDINPNATRLMKALDFGVMGFSIHFNPFTAKAVYNPSREFGDERDAFMPPLDYVEQELLELSLVNIGGNANSVAVRSFTTDEATRIAALRAAAKKTTRSSNQEKTVTFEQLMALLAGLGITLSDEQKTKMQEQLNQQTTSTSGGGEGGAAAAPKPPAGEPGRAAPNAEQVMLAERARIDGIRSLVKRASKDRDNFPAELEEKLVKGGSTVEAASRAILDVLVDAQPEIRSTRIEGGETDGEKFVRGAVNAIISRAGKRTLIETARAKKIPGFDGDTSPGAHRRILEIAVQSLSRRGVKIGDMTDEKIIGKAMTHGRRDGGSAGSTDFPVIISMAAERVLLASYELQPHVWRDIVKVEEVANFKGRDLITPGAVPNLEGVNEHGELKTINISDGETKNVKLATKGGILRLTRELLINDDLGAFLDRAAQLGFAADRTIEDAVFALLAANGGAGPTIGGNNFFSAPNANLGTTSGLTADGVNADLVLLADQKDKNGNYMSLSSSVLLVGTSQKMKAGILNTSEKDPDTGTKVGRDNGVRGSFSKIVSSPRIAGTKRYVMADPNIAAALVVTFLEGKQLPSIETDDQWETAGTDMRIIHDHLAQVFEPRAAVYNPGQ